MSGMRYRVSEVSRIAHVTVRTLHHYDEIGLLTPSDRSRKGYRLYSSADLQRLHQILLFRELGFSLEGIGEILDAPAFDRTAALRAQRELLRERVERTENVIRAVDSALRALEGDETMDEKEMFQGLEGFEDAPYAEEAKERWGETESYKESMKRAKGYSSEDWARMKEESDAVEARLAHLFVSGKKPDDPESMDAAEAHRLHIDRWFYPVSHAFHVGLAEMYVADPRFTEHYAKRAPGLAHFVRAAVEANAERASG